MQAKISVEESKIQNHQILKLKETLKDIWVTQITFSRTEQHQSKGQ
jgi:hypothetical protein